MAKQVMTSKAKEKYTGLDYSSLITIPAEPRATEDPAQGNAKETQAAAPAGYKLNPAYVEKRTRRVQLVFQPSLYEKAEAKYKALGYRSFNDYINSILEAELNKEIEK